MKKILISIKQNSLVFSYKTSISKEKNNLLNTNIISDNELVFSDEYILKNQKIVGLFIKELCSDKNIDNVIISTNELALLIIKVLKYNNLISTINIKENNNLTFTICEEIAKNKYIKKINCFSAPTFMLEYLDRFNKIIETRNETFYVSNFMIENNLQQFSKLYYKTSIRLSFPITDDDLNDLYTFFKINRYLKNIHVNKLSLEVLDIITNIIKKEKLKNIKVIIHDDNPDEQCIEKLKKLNKKFKLRYKVVFKLSYSKEYLNDNIFKQIIINTLKICGLITFLIISGILVYTFISNYKSMKKVTTIRNEIKSVIKENKENDLVIDNNENDNNNEPQEKDMVTSKDLLTLLDINPDVFGWLKVNNTDIEYPVLQTTDNSYYLNHDFYKEKDKYGWIYMDYRNSKSDILNRNIIIYGHTYSYSTSMFSTLKNAYSKSWYTNEENQIITFNTIHNNMKWKIFSIYKIPVTTDYLQVYFSNDDEFVEFGNMIKQRSIYDFNEEITANDYILTLSTCSGNDYRLVVHAKLIQ